MVSDVSLSCSLGFEVGHLLLHAMNCYALGVLEMLFLCLFAMLLFHISIAYQQWCLVIDCVSSIFLVWLRVGLLHLCVCRAVVCTFVILFVCG